MPDGKDLNGICYYTVHDVKDLTVSVIAVHCSRCLTVKMPDGKDLNGICYCTVHDA